MCYNVEERSENITKLKKSISTEKLEIPFAFDLLFKKMFGDEYNLLPMKILLKRILSLFPNKLVILNSELINRPYKDKKTACDLIVEVDDNLKLNFEINTSVKNPLINRNIRLLCLNMSKDLAAGKEYTEIKSQMQLNFDLEGSHTLPIEEYSLLETTVHKELSDIFKIYRYDIPYFFKKCYTEGVDSLDDLSRLLALFGARTRKEVEYICKGDEELEEIQKQYEKYVDDEDVIGAYDLEWDRKELARIEKEEAIEETTKEVTKQNKIEIAKNMLKETKDFSFISRVTGLDIDTIEGLQ